MVNCAPVVAVFNCVPDCSKIHHHRIAHKSPIPVNPWRRKCAVIRVWRLVPQSPAAQPLHRVPGSFQHVHDGHARHERTSVGDRLGSSKLLLHHQLLLLLLLHLYLLLPLYQRLKTLLSFSYTVPLPLLTTSAVKLRGHHYALLVIAEM